ncbi:RluA family pseudouridine synthase [Bacillus daqingensis]|uniref:RNA pseudouridylate synthase n=1 Tax=Bacillus daqingensis TaxID=872396 RepID=A0ABV9NTM9_9BACI
MNILYEDNHLIAVEKPVNIPVQGDESKDTSLFDMVKEDIKVRYQKPGAVYLGLLHRLDRPVGGAILFAKTSKAASRVSDLIRRQQMDKTYLAVVRGIPPERAGTLEHYLWKDRQKNEVYVRKPGTEGAKHALLTYETLAQHNGLALVRIQLLTGRSHQIRVQFAETGCPLYGDQKYGSSVNKPGEQIALWSARIGLTHPVKREPLEVLSSPPKEYPWNQFGQAAFSFLD